MPTLANVERPTKGPPPVSRMSNRRLAAELADFGNRNNGNLLKPEDFLTFLGKAIAREDLETEVLQVRTQSKSLWVKEVLERKRA